MAQQGTRGTNGKPSPLTLEKCEQRFRLLRRCYMDRVKVYIGLVIPVFAVRFIMCTVQAVRDLFDAAEILRCVFGGFLAGNLPAESPVLCRLRNNTRYPRCAC